MIEKADEKETFNPKTFGLTSQQAIERVKDEHKDSGSGNWFADNIVAPAVNHGGIDFYNTAAGVVNAGAKLVSGNDLLPKCELMASQKAEFGTGNWLAQTISGGLGGLVPYIVAGKAMGGALRSTGRAMEVEGVTARLMASERTSLILGAGAYDFAKEPGEGQTRWGNAVGSMVGFSMFELGNGLTHGLSLSKSIPLRALTGFIGGSSGHATANYVSTGEFGDGKHLFEAGVSGSVMNLALPAMQEGAGRLIDNVNFKLNRGAPVGRYVERQGWGDNTSLTDVVNQSPLTRVQPVDQPGSSINIKSNIVELGRNQGPEKLGHEINHRLTAKDPAVQERYARVAEMVDPKSPDFNVERAWETYRDLRQTQELAARSTENAIIDADGAKAAKAEVRAENIGALQAKEGMTYEQLWKTEFEQFKETQGKFRPEKEFSGEEKGAYYDPDTKLVTEFSSEPRTYKVGEEEIRAIGYERNIEKTFERFTKTDAVVIEGHTWGQIEYHHEGKMTNWGTATRIETFPDKSFKLHIKEGANNVDNGSIFEVYPNLKRTEFGYAHTIERLANGEVIVTKLGDQKTWEYPEGNDMSFGKVTKIDQREDGITAFYTTKGDVLEQHVGGSSDSNYGELPLVLRKANGDVQYSNSDGKAVDIQRVDGKLRISEIENGEVTKTFDTTEPVVETFPESKYPMGKVTKHGQAVSIEIRPTDTVYQLRDGKTVVEFPEPVATDFGVVKHVLRESDKTVFVRVDGSQYQEFNQPLLTPYGKVTGMEVSADGKQQILTRAEGGSVKVGDSAVEEYPNGLATTLGSVTKVERSGDKVTYTKADGSVVEVPMVGDPTIMQTDRNGAITEVRADKVIEQYPEGRETIYGTVEKVIVRTDGTIVMKLLRDPKLIEVTEYAAPIQTKLGQIRSVGSMRNGNMEVRFTDGTEKVLPPKNLENLMRGGDG